MLQYVLANAAVARSFAGYFANLIGKPSDFFTIMWKASTSVSFDAFDACFMLDVWLCVL